MVGWMLTVRNRMAGKTSEMWMLQTPCSRVAAESYYYSYYYSNSIYQILGYILVHFPCCDEIPEARYLINDFLFRSQFYGLEVQ